MTDVNRALFKHADFLLRRLANAQYHIGLSECLDPAPDLFRACALVVLIVDP